MYFLQERKRSIKSNGLPYDKGIGLKCLSCSMMGNKRRLGTKHSDKTRKKMSLSSLGKKKSLQHRLNMSKARMGVKTGRIPKSAFKKGIYTEAMRKGSLLGAKTLSERKITSIEKKVYEELKRRDLLFETQKLINGRFLVDAYIPSLNLVIEADGDYWHNLDRIKKKDKAENAYLTKCGFNLVRWREADINTDVKSLFNQIGLN